MGYNKANEAGLNNYFYGTTKMIKLLSNGEANSEVKLLSNGDIQDVTGIPRKTLELWCKAKFIHPDHLGTGRGNHHRFSLMQAIGIALAWKVFTSNRGCNFNFVTDIIDCFSTETKESLFAELEKGNTHLLPAPDGEIALGPPRSKFTEECNVLKQLKTSLRVLRK